LGVRVPPGLPYSEYILLVKVGFDLFGEKITHVN